jgi:predicted AlkP superfamily phosphohydrolase/phosphomutase
MTARLLIIALDGADGHTLDTASGDGTLRNLSALRKQGCAWALSSEQGVTDDALWASFQYGVDLAEHGRYSWQTLSSAGKPIVSFMAEADRETFWDDLSEHGLRVAVLDAPKCRPPRPLNGIHLVDWLAHGRYYPHGPVSYPPSLAGEVVSRFGAAPYSRCGYEPGILNDEDVKEIVDNLFRSVQQKRAAGLHFLSAENWDLFFIAFKEAHCGCHMFWDFADPVHKRHDAARAAQLGNPILDILKRQDAAIGELVAAARPGANVVVFSTSDFVPNGSISHLLPELVRRLNGYLESCDWGKAAASAGPRTRKWSSFSDVISISHSDDFAALRVQRRYWENKAAYSRRLDLVAALLWELVDAEGIRVVSSVTRPSSEHIGKRAKHLPDLLAHIRTNCCPRAVMSPRLGRLEAPIPEIRTGNHAAGGFVFAVGPCAHNIMAEIRTMKDFAPVVKDILVEKGGKDVSSSRAIVWRRKKRAFRHLGRRFLGRIKKSSHHQFLLASLEDALHGDDL